MLATKEQKKLEMQNLLEEQNRRLRFEWFMAVADAVELA